MNRRSLRWVAAILALTVVAAACDDSDDGENETGNPPAEEQGAPSVSFTDIEDGATVTSPVRFGMEAENLTIEPAGEVNENAGHFHVMVDVGCVEPGETTPGDEGYNHFGKAQTRAKLDLTEGEHTLCLQVGDGEHTALDVTDEITITVEGEGPDVAITSPEDGAEVTSPVTVEMEATNFTIEPAGEVNENAGHFHVMVDVGCVEPGETIPGDEGYNHFGDGSVTAELELTPGEHTICLQVGDGAHTASVLTHEITVTVIEA